MTPPVPSPEEPERPSGATGGAPPPAEADATRAPLAPLAGVVGALAVSNVMANEVLPGWAYVPWNCLVAAGIVGFAVRRDGQTLASMGLSPQTAPAGLRLGLGFSAVLVGVYAVGLALPSTRDLFLDERADVGSAQMAYKVLVEVPLGTVLLEEVAFRGVLPAMFRARVRPGRRAGFTADAASAGLFGLWHILPSWNVSQANPVFRDTLPDTVGQAAGILGGVVATAAAGMGLSWMRNRSDSVLAPATLHATGNGVGSLLAWLAHRMA